MSTVKLTTKKQTPRLPRTSIKHDPIHPSDYLKYKRPWACEDCTHFHHEQERCTLGYQSSHHRRSYQEECYRLTGKMALCRFLEID